MTGGHWLISFNAGQDLLIYVSRIRTASGEKLDGPQSEQVTEGHWLISFNTGQDSLIYISRIRTALGEKLNGPQSEKVTGGHIGLFPSMQVRIESESLLLDVGN